MLGLKQIHIGGETHTNVNYTLYFLHPIEYKNLKTLIGGLDKQIAMHVREDKNTLILF